MRKVMILLAVFLIMPGLAYAYIDLGTGSVLTQLIIASIAGILLFIKDIWRSFMNFFNKKKKQDDE